MRAGLKPSTLTWPDEISVRPSIIRMVVVLPAPFGPSRPNTSPLRMPNEIGSTATALP